jgi:hypothetical protein
MADTDLFDDDAFFTNLDLAVLDQVEAQAISSTQAVKETDNRHHTIPPPQKEPRPINTEPRAGGKSTFGFGELGKHTHPANETRYIDGVEQRKQYWGLKRDDDLDYPAVTVDATGRYGLAQDSDDDEMVVDLHAPGGRALAFGRQRALQPDPSSQGARAKQGPVEISIDWQASHYSAHGTSTVQPRADRLSILTAIFARITGPSIGATTR